MSSTNSEGSSNDMDSRDSTDSTRLIRVTAVDYKEEGSEGDETLVVQLAGRDSDGERFTGEILGTEPYLYVPEEEEIPIELLENVEYRESGFESFDGKALEKVVTRLPQHVEKIAESVDDDHEADIPYYRRVSIDYGLSGYVRLPEGRSRIDIDEIETGIDISEIDVSEPRSFIADIEVVRDPSAPGSFNQMMKDYDAKITNITVWDSHEDEYVCLYLDPEGYVSGSMVKEYLDDAIGGTEVAEELEKDILLRGYESEPALLRGFISLCSKRNPDINSGWNFVEFDWDYILGRMGRLSKEGEKVFTGDLSDIGSSSGYQVERRIDCVPAFDLMGAYEKMMTPVKGKMRSYSLGYVAKDEVGVGKIPDVGVFTAFEQDRSQLLAYNIVDVILTVVIEQRQETHDFYYELSELSQVQIYDTFSEMRLIDGYMMSRSDSDEILPSATEEDIDENAGGLVLNPSDGVYDWVGVLDLKSLYPSCMITWNLSPETIHFYEDEQPDHDQFINVPWLPDADHAEGGDFSLSDIRFDKMWVDLREEGLIPRFIKRLFPERERMKELRDGHAPDSAEYELFDRRQSVIKVLMNAFYGVSSMKYWRLATEGLGDAITSAARFALWQGKEIAEGEGYNVVYGDTDSVMVSLAGADSEKHVAIDQGEKLERVVNQSMSCCVEHSGLSSDHPFLDGSLHGTDRHTLVYEFEKLYRRFFQAGKKKRYAGNIVWKEGKDVDEMDLVGFESQRSDSPELTSDVQPEVIRRILEGNSFEELSEYVSGIVADLRSDSMEQYRLALPNSLNQPLEEYENTQTARACRFSNEHLDGDWGVGDDPWISFIDRTEYGEPNTDVIALSWDEEIPEGYELDYEKTIERALISPLEPILDEVGWDFRELKHGVESLGVSESETWEETEWKTDHTENSQWDW